MFPSIRGPRAIFFKVPVDSLATASLVPVAVCMIANSCRGPVVGCSGIAKNPVGDVLVAALSWIWQRGAMPLTLLSC